MKNREKLTYSKGISPLIASVLLIAFTISISMIIMAWFTIFSKSTTSNISGTASDVMGCNSAMVTIDHIYIGSSTTNTSSILIRNSGFVQLNVTGMLLSSGGSTCANSTGTNIAKGGIATLYFQNCTAFPNGKTDWSRAIVATNCGSVSDSSSDAGIVN